MARVAKRWGEGGMETRRTVRWGSELGRRGGEQADPSLYDKGARSPSCGVGPVGLG
jgi:hypothetical protein